MSSSGTLSRRFLHGRSGVGSPQVFNERRTKLGLSDQPDTELKVVEETSDDRTLTGVVETTLPGARQTESTVRKQRFRIEYSESGEISSCELLD